MSAVCHYSHESVAAAAVYQRATVDSVIVSESKAVTDANAQLVRDSSKFKFLPLVSRL